MPEEAWRLFRRSLMSVLVDAQSADLRVQGLAWYPEFRRCSGGSGYWPMALGEGRFAALRDWLPVMLQSKSLVDSLSQTLHYRWRRSRSKATGPLRSSSV